MPSLLETLIQPLTEEEFFRAHWPTNHFVHHGSLDRLPFLANELAEVIDRMKLIGRWQGTITAWPKKGSGMPELETIPSQANELFRAGYTLFFRDIEKQIPSVRRLMNRFAEDVGVSPEDVVCEGFFSPPGAGAAPHFDGNWGFNIQLTGTKEWIVAPNENVEVPGIGMAMGARPEAILEPYSRLPFPNEMPAAQSTSFIAEPGSIVFVPCGMWHRTHVQKEGEESAAIVLTIKPRHWAKRIAEHVERELSVALAARMTPLLAIPHLAEEQRDQLHAVTSCLIDIARALDPDALMHVWSKPFREFFSIAPCVKIAIEERPGDQWDFEIVQGERSFRSTIARENGEILRWAVSAGTFTFREICDAFTAVPTESLRVRLSDLESTRLIIRRDRSDRSVLSPSRTSTRSNKKKSARSAKNAESSL
jgi:50S ribosomal protein L16 3-hydroxylase